MPAANTEGGRLQRKIARMGPGFIPVQGNDCGNCLPKNSIQFPITQSENSRILALTANFNGTTLVGAGVTQDRAKQLLATSITMRQFGSEGVRIAAVEQETMAAAPNQKLLPPIVLTVCPPLPAPPAPPPRACPLAKNQKLGGN